MSMSSSRCWLIGPCCLLLIDSGQNGEIVIPTERPVSLSVANGITLLAKQDCQSEASSDRGSWRGDIGWPFRNGRAVSPRQILPSLTVLEFTPDSNGKYLTKFNTLRTSPLVRMTTAPYLLIGNQQDGTRLVLRDLTVIETDALQFDADRVMDANGKSYDWDQIHSAVLNDGRQQEFDRLLREFGISLFRVRHRLANQDWNSLSEVVEPLYAKQLGIEVTDTNRRNRYLLSLATFRSRLAKGDLADALIPFMEACEIGGSQPANEPIGIQGIQDVDLSADEIRDQFTPLLPPIWFDIQAARRCGPELKTCCIKDLKQATDGALIYLVSLSLAADDTESAVIALDELSRRSGPLVETWLPILRVEMEIGKKINGSATDALRKSYRRLQGPERAVANYLLALQIGDNPDDFDSAILDLLYIPANYGSSMYSLSAAALHQAALISTRAGKLDEAELFKSELSKNYQNTYHGRLQIVK